MGAGKTATNKVSDNGGLVRLKDYAEAGGDPRVSAALQKYSSGGMSLQDALKGLSPDRSGEYSKLDTQMKEAFARGDMKGGEAISDQMNRMQYESSKGKARQDQIFTDPMTGSLAAAEQVQTNPLLSGMFGKGGMQEQLLAEQKDLAGRGYSLQPEDYEAYGQASDETARTFDQEANSLASALASRGMASGASGAAGAAFSGLAGNKSERLAASQRRIADDRMKSNQARLDSVRGFAMQGNQQGMSALSDQYDRNQQGIKSYKDSLKDAVSAGQIEQGQENAQFEQHEATSGQNAAKGMLGSALGAGLGAATGGLGTSLGAGLGKKLGGAALTKLPKE